VVDPAPAIAAIENKKSYTQPDEKTARYNMIPHNNTLKGIKNTEKYKIDYFKLIVFYINLDYKTFKLKH
jgi:hypothetical protein